MIAKVLIVDDNEKNVDMLSAKMRAEGYHVVSASNGIAALDTVDTERPDIILLDIMMPKIDGIEVCRRLKSNEETRYIPIIMLTARGELDDKVTGLDAGAEDYIVKPFNLSEISARVKTILKMRSLQKELMESEKLAALGKMVDGIAHELRNPLVTIGGLARRLQASAKDEKQREYSKTIVTSVERLEHMIERVDEFKQALYSETEPTELNSVITDLKERALSLIQDDKQIDIIVDTPEDEVIIDANRANLLTALTNIIQNSIDAITDKGTVIIMTTTQNKTITLKIKDNGKGMDHDALMHVFHPFYTSKTKGAGLGLAISNRIIQDHGGKITVKSTPDEGTTFTITLKSREVPLKA
ncbi:MAG: response regulator [Deltaproteobacteria bacterium]|nr:response regulator [Deltaproteobacteria bacterium]